MATVTLYRCESCGLLYQVPLYTFAMTGPSAPEPGASMIVCDACINSITLLEFAARAGWVKIEPPPVPVKIV